MLSSPAAAGHAMASKANTSIVRIVPSASARHDRDSLRRIVMVAGWIEDRLQRLARADGVRGPDHHGMRAGRQDEREGPGAEGEPAEILAELGQPPARSAIRRHLDALDPVAAVPGDAPHL